MSRGAAQATLEGDGGTATAEKPKTKPTAYVVVEERELFEPGLARLQEDGASDFAGAAEVERDFEPVTALVVLDGSDERPIESTGGDRAACRLMAERLGWPEEREAVMYAIPLSSWHRRTRNVERQVKITWS